MKNLSLLTLLFVLLVASPILSNGQQFGNNGSTANVNNPVRNTEPLTVDLLEKNFPAVNISSWEGEQFVFAPLPNGLSESGYIQVFPKSGEKGKAKYDKFVGRIVKVTKITNVSSSYMLNLETLDNGEQLTGLAIGGTLEGLVPMRDINAAKKTLIGQNVWIRSGGLAVYNPQDVMGSEYMTISPLEAVKIVGIEPAWLPDAPIRIVIETASGKKGYKDVSISGTNIRGSRQYHKMLDDFSISEDEIKAVAVSHNKMCQEWKSFPAGDFAWQKARFGMTGAQIESAFGSEVKKYANPDVYSGAYVEHKIPSLILSGQNFTVYFQMDSYTSCLSKILIAPAKEGAKLNSNSAEEVAQQLEQSLTEKYGQPQKLRDEKDRSGINRRLLWKNGTTDIQLNLTIYSGSSIEPMLSLSYEPNNKKDSSKL